MYMTKITKIVFVIAITIISITACSKRSPEQLLLDAKANIEKNDYSTAVIELKSVISLDASSYEARILLGRAYLYLSDWDNSEKELRRALDMGAPSKEVYPDLIRTLYYQEDFQGVIDSVTKTMNLENDKQESIKLLAYLADLRRNQSEAFKVEMPELENQDKINIAYAYLAFVTNDATKADNIIADGITSTEHQAEVLFLQGLVKDKLSQLDEAAASFSSLLDIYPNYHMVRLMLIDALIRNNELEQASEHISLLMDVNPDQPQINFYKGAVEFLSKNYETSFLHTQKAKDGEVNDIRNELIHGLSAYRLDNLQQAYGSLSRAARIMPPNHSVHRLLTQIQLTLGYRDDAIENLESFSGDNELDLVLFENAATLFAREQDYVAARRQLEKANDVSKSSSADRLLREGLMRVALNDLSGIEFIQQSIEQEPEVVQKWLLLADVFVDQGMNEEASELVARLAEQDKEAALVLEGQILVRQENLIEAISRFKQVLEINSSSIPAANNLIKAYMSLGQLEDARQAIYSALEQHPENKIAATELVKIARQTEFSDADLTFINELMKKNPEAETPKLTITTWYREQGKLQDAMRVLEQSKSSLSNSGLMALGDIYYNQGMLNNAAEIYELWQTEYPDDIQSVLRLVAVYAQQNNPQKFRLFLDDAVQRFPNAEPLRIAQLQNFIKDKRYLEAQRAYDDVVNAGSKNIILSKFKGQLALASGEPEKAIEPLKTFYEYGKNLENLLNLSFAYIRSENTEQAREAFKQHVSEVDNSPRSLAVAAEFMLSHHYYDDAILYYEAILRNQSDSLIAQNNVAMAYIGKGDMEAALKAAEAANKLAPTSPATLDTYGWALYNNGKTVEAESVLLLAHQSLQDDPGIALHYARVLISNDKHTQAQEVLSNIRANTLKQRETVFELKNKIK